jgi:general secretion pathway protein L
MLVELYTWWLARMQELTAPLRSSVGARATDGVVIALGEAGQLHAFLRNGQREDPLGLNEVPRAAGRRPVALQVLPRVVLEKTHTLPSVSAADMHQILRHEMPRITPFQADAVYWQWNSRPVPGDRSRLLVDLTIVPKVTISAALAVLNQLGVVPHHLEVGQPPSRSIPLTMETVGHTSVQAVRRSLVWATGALAAGAVLLPFLLQTWAFHRTQTAMDALQPAVHQVDILRHGINASTAGSDILARERQRTGDVPSILADVTRVLPDGSYLTDLALRQRQLTVGGRSKSAPNLITALSADQAFRNASFAAPVTRINGTELDVFSIRAEVAP